MPPTFRRPTPRRLARALALGAALACAAGPARAQWTRVNALPITDVNSLFVRGDSTFAGVDTAVWRSVNGGASWQVSARVAPAVQTVSAVWFRNGRLWAGTYGQGIYSSDNLGASWTARNQGLTGGVLGSHNFIKDFESRGDSLYAATDGAGVYRLDLRAANPSWVKFGAAFELNTAGGVQVLGLHGTKLLAGAGGNGLIFTNDPGEGDWTPTFIGGGMVPGLILSGIAITPGGAVAAGNGFSWWSATGEAPWVGGTPGVGAVTESPLAARGSQVFGAFNKLGATWFAITLDLGDNWALPDPSTPYTYALAPRGDVLYAARTDGLWTRSIATVSVPPDPPATSRIALAIEGPSPCRGDARFRVTAPAGERALLRVFDARGREIARLLDGPAPAASSVVAWSPPSAAVGVYFAQLVAGGTATVLRFVRLP